MNRSRHEQDEGRGFSIGLLCGTALGLAIGLLFAPKPGAEMRRTLYGSAEDFRRRAQEAYERTADEVERAISQGRPVTEQFGSGSDFGDRTGQNRQTGAEFGAKRASNGT